MAREKRRVSPTGIYHVLLRGIDELFSEEKDFEEFTALTEKYFENSEAKLLGYALMKNRVHLIIDEGKKGLSAVMKPICTSYARYYNRVHDMQGKLFYDRYKSEPVADDAGLEEVRAFLCAIPSTYKNGEGKKSENISLSCIDDYCRMTDEELLQYIENIFACTVSALSKDEKKALAEKIIAGKRVSAGRIYKLMGLGRRNPEPKPGRGKDMPPRKKKKEEREPERKSGLSVWLL